MVILTGCNNSPPAGEEIEDTQILEVDLSDVSYPETSDLSDTHQKDIEETVTAFDPSNAPLCSEKVSENCWDPADYPELKLLVGKWCHVKEGCNFPTSVEFSPQGVGVRFIGSQHDLLGTVDFIGHELPLIEGGFDEFDGGLYMFTIDLNDKGQLQLRRYDWVPLKDPADFDPDDFEHDNEQLFQRAN